MLEAICEIIFFLLVYLLINYARSHRTGLTKEDLAPWDFPKEWANVEPDERAVVPTAPVKWTETEQFKWCKTQWKAMVIATILILCTFAGGVIFLRITEIIVSLLFIIISFSERK